jgi:hypothetical protein
LHRERIVSNEEKGQWVYLVVSVLMYCAYLAVVLGQAGPAAVTDVDYVPVMLGAIGITIVLSIIGRIGVEIAGGLERQDADVRDRDIGRFGEYFAGTVLGVGMVVPFLLAMTEQDHFWIANAMYLVFALSAVTGAVIKLVAYRRGI